MAEAAQVLTRPVPTTERPVSRRFELPDLDRHGVWIMERLLKAYPHLTSREMIGWLKGLVYSSEHMFLYQENAVGLAQVERSHTLTPKPVIRERFVFARDPENKRHIADACELYVEFARWAGHHGADVVIVDELTDVSRDAIKDKLGQRVFVKEQAFVRLGKQE